MRHPFLARDVLADFLQCRSCFGFRPVAESLGIGRDSSGTSVDTSSISQGRPNLHNDLLDIVGTSLQKGLPGLFLQQFQLRRILG